MNIYRYKEIKKMNIQDMKKIKSVKCPDCHTIFTDKDDVFLEKHAIRNYGRCFECENNTRDTGFKIEDNVKRITRHIVSKK